MIELEIDGKKVSAESGSTILEVALREDKYIPHFCYHKKLSIAANCRMCLVEVEKSGKPLPACATPVTEGMKVHTCSKLAIDAQKGVMEFLLINHPLDCPICDQGGECQLQDLAVGYGGSHSRFEEPKRAVTNKDLGSLVSTEMTRCIHCSRCVRFTDEIAGYQELGMSYRNNHVEVMPFIGKTVDSEVSGNIIDICPVGALTSKPFRNRARSWELSRRKSIAPHDGLGSNIVVQVDKYHKVVRVLPNENEAINQCWLSDRDRFSYEGLYHSERNTKPMIKQDDKWLEVDWEVALNYAAKSIAGTIKDHGASSVGVLASATSTTEELYLLQKAMRAVGVNNLDHRLTQSDFSLDESLDKISYLGMKVEDLEKAKSILLLGSLVREEQPLIAYRIRSAVKKGAKLNVISVMQEDLLCKVNQQVTIDPREIEYFVAQLVKASGNTPSTIDLSQVEVSESAKQMVEDLKLDDAVIVLGEITKSSPNYSKILILINQLSENLKVKVAHFSQRANEVGANLVGFTPHFDAFGVKVKQAGLNATQMLEAQCKCYVVFNTEPEYDTYNSKLATKALMNANTVVVFSPYLTDAMRDYADVILPITPFSETAGSFVNMEGTWQTFNGVTKPLGESKPGWKVLRVLANCLNIADFEYESILDVRAELEVLNNAQSLLSNQIAKFSSIKVEKPKLDSLVRFGLQGIYNLDSITRRADALQQTKFASLPTLAISPNLAKQHNLSNEQTVSLEQERYARQYTVSICDKLPDTVVLLAIDKNTTSFGGRFDSINIR